MRNIKLIFLILLLSCFIINSTVKGQDLNYKINGKTLSKQDAELEIKKMNKSINDEQERYYKNLNSNYIKSGFLIDQLLFSKEKLLNYSSSLDTNVSATNWRNIFQLLYKSQFKTNTLDSLQKVNKKANRIYNFGHIPIGIINIDFELIKKDAFKKNLMRIDNNKLSDYSSSRNSAYSTENIKIASPLISSWNSLNVSFSIDKELYYTNSKNTISIEIDFDDDFGFRTVELGQVININYSSSGEKIIRISLNQKDNKKKVSWSSFTVIGNNDLPQKSLSSGSGYRDPDNTHHLTDGSRAYIEYGCNNNNKIMKPFVFVEGLNFTPDAGCEPENELRYGTFGWDVFRRGQDLPYNITKPYADPLNISYLPDLIEKLKNDGFDIILLDFKDGSGSIESNADNLIELINWLNNQLLSNNSNNKLVVAGASMGGVVTRFALSKMEQTNQNHNTRLYLSFDAPHNGANIPIGDQILLDFFGGIDLITLFQPDILVALNKLKKMAPKQLLNYHFQGPDARQSLISNPYYQFPKEPYSISIANGSYNATDQGFSPGDKMIDKDDFVGGIIQAETYAVSPGGKVFWGRVWIALFYMELENSCSNCKPYDSAPGATRNTNRDIGQEDVIYPNHCFVPTISALAMNTSDLYYNISTSPLMENYPFIRENNKYLCPFDMIYVNTDGSNEDHVETSINNVPWITDKTSPENLMLQHLNLEGRYEARTSITLGENIYSGSSSPNTGIVGVLPGKNAQLIAGESITFKPGFTAYQGSILNASLKNFCSTYAIPMRSKTVTNKNQDTKTVNFIYQAITNETLTNTNKVVDLVNVFPNPNHGTLNIAVNKTNLKVYLIQITNPVGQIVYERKTDKNQMVINLSNNDPGIYIVRIVFDDETITKKIILE